MEILNFYIWLNLKMEINNNNIKELKYFNITFFCMYS